MAWLLDRFLELNSRRPQNHRAEISTTCMAVWHIWRNRNDKIFGRSDAPPLTVASRILINVEEFLFLDSGLYSGRVSARPPVDLSLSPSWIPEPLGTLKMNFYAGFGFVYCGSIIAAGVRTSLAASPALAETLAACWAIEESFPFIPKGSASRAIL